MANQVPRLHSVIMIIPVISSVNGGMILSEIGDIHHFSEPKKLLVFAGLDFSVHQSGNFQTQRTKMSKRGSKVLRYALMNATHNVGKIMRLSKFITILREPKTGHTTMHLDTVPKNLSESSEKYSQTM